MSVRHLVLEAVMDDWISDYEIQGDFQVDGSLSASEAFRQLVPSVADWIRRDVLVPGAMLDGFEPWLGSAEENGARFVAAAAEHHVLTRPGQVCWFDAGPAATAELEAADSH